MAATRRYRFLSFQPGVDWRDVNQHLLTRLNRLGMKLGQIITVTSGYRTYAEQAALYKRYQQGGNIAAKPGQSLHERGLAVDAEINGKAIGNVIKAQTLRKYGLATPVKGDPVHVQLVGKAADTAMASAPTSGAPNADAIAATAQQQDAQLASSIPSIPDQGMSPGAPPQPEESVPSVFAPGSLNASDYTPKRTAETWQLLAAQPLASPETQSYAQRAALAAGG